MESETLINRIDSPLSSKASPISSPMSMMSPTSSNHSTPPNSASAGLSDDGCGLPSSLSPNVPMDSSSLASALSHASSVGGPGGPSVSTSGVSAGPGLLTSSLGSHPSHHHHHHHSSSSPYSSATSHGSASSSSAAAAAAAAGFFHPSMRSVFPSLYTPVSLGNGKDTFTATSPMCVPLSAFYGSAFAPPSSYGTNSFLSARSHLAPAHHAYATQMSLFNNYLTQAAAGRSLMGVTDEHKPVISGGGGGGGGFSPTAYRSLSTSYQHHLKSTFPLCSNSAAAAAVAAAAAANNAINAAVTGGNSATSSGSNSSTISGVTSAGNSSGAPGNLCRGSISPPPYKRRHADDISTFNDRLSSYVNGTLSRPWSRPRSPSQPLKCPLCLVSLEGSDIASHFVEEVHQLEALRSRITEWESKENNIVDIDIKNSEHEDGFKRSRLHGDKMPPCTRWQTYQRVKQNRHTRISGILRGTKRFDDREKIEDTTTTCKPINRGIWTIVDDIKTHHQYPLLQDDRESKHVNSTSTNGNCDDISKRADNYPINVVNNNNNNVSNNNENGSKLNDSCENQNNSNSNSDNDNRS